MTDVLGASPRAVDGCKRPLLLNGHTPKPNLFMDSMRHGYQNLNPGGQTAHWATVNQPTYPNVTLVPTSAGGQVVTQTTTPATPVTKPGPVPFKLPGGSMNRVILPRPVPVHRSQSNSKSCLICGKSNCPLRSHKHFADQVLTRKRSKQPITPTKGKTPVRPATGPSKPPEQFVHYPVAMDPERDQLLSLWSQEWSRVRRGPERHLFPKRWIDHVLQSAMAHAPLFQALLATSASFWAMAHNIYDEATARNMQLADRVLNEICTDQKTAAEDEYLLAGLLLTVVHQAQGNARETDRRFANIVSLVRSRGGPYYLGMSGIVADMLLYVDYLQAALLDCEPVWTLPLPALEIGIPQRLGSAFRELSSSNLFNTDLLLAADSICRTTDIFEQPLGGPVLDSSASHSFGYLSTVAEYQLAHCNAVFHGSCTWNECVCLGLLLFNHIILRNDGVITASIRKIEHQLWQTIDSTISREGSQAVPPCLLLWLLITGLSSCILTDCQYRWTAVKRMRAAKITAAINSWDHFRTSVLDDFVWVRVAQEETFRDVWLEVEGYKNDPSGRR